MYSILGRGSFCFNYCLNSAWHGGDQFVALLRWYGSPGFFDSGLQLICIFWSLVSHFPLDNTQLLVLLAVWAGAISCWKMKSASLKSWSAEGSMKCSKISWYTGAVTLVLKKHNGPTPADDIAPLIIRLWKLNTGEDPLIKCCRPTLHYSGGLFTS